MRLDTLGKPPLLQVVTETKNSKGPAPTGPVGEVRQVAETSSQSPFPQSQDQGKLGQILELLAKNKRLSKRRASFAFKQYKKVESYVESNKIGSSLDVSG